MYKLRSKDQMTNPTPSPVLSAELKISKWMNTQLLNLASDTQMVGKRRRIALIKELEKKISHAVSEAVLAKEEEIKELVDKTKKDIWNLPAQGRMSLKGETLALITKYQALNMINLNNLPHTPPEATSLQKEDK